jgi:hypothetical protein
VTIAGDNPVGDLSSLAIPVGEGNFAWVGLIGAAVGRAPIRSLIILMISLLHSHALMASAIIRRDLCISSKSFL